MYTLALSPHSSHFTDISLWLPVWWQSIFVGWPRDAVSDSIIRCSAGFFWFSPLSYPRPLLPAHLQLYAITSLTHSNSWHKAKENLTTCLLEVAYVVNENAVRENKVAFHRQNEFSPDLIWKFYIILVFCLIYQSSSQRVESWDVAVSATVAHPEKKLSV